VRPEGLDKFEKIHLIGTRSLDLPACSIVPQLLRCRVPVLTLLYSRNLFDFQIFFRSTRSDLQSLKKKRERERLTSVHFLIAVGKSVRCMQRNNFVIMKLGSLFVDGDIFPKL
jgi:hypothetical protein